MPLSGLSDPCLSHSFQGYSIKSLLENNPSGPKLSLKVNTSNGWRPFCHPTWDNKLAHEVCRVNGFREVLDLEESDSDKCSENVDANKMDCYNHSLTILPTCNDKKAIVICKDKSSSREYFMY